MTEDESAEWIEDYLDGDRSPELLAQLRGHLADGEENVKLFARKVFLHQQLRNELFSQAAIERLQKTDLANTAVLPRVLSRARLWPLAGAAAFAVAAAFLVMGWPVRLNVEGKIEGEQIAGQKSTENTSRDNATQLPVITALNAGKSSTTLQLKGIGYVTIEGPTDFCLIGPMRARLNYGRVKVRVTEKTGHGFIVETPDGEVTDLGTEFTLNVTQGNDTSLIVREGMVDLRAGTLPQSNKPERLVTGDGVTFNKEGRLDRIMSIISTEGQPFGAIAPEPLTEKPSLIQSVTDNLHSSDTKKFYEIVPGGLREDVRAYVDRGYEWNGCDAAGIPEFLLGAEYVRTFNDYKRRAFKIELELSRPANIYVFWDERAPLTDWLMKDFTNTGLFIGLDELPSKHNYFTPGELRAGPGESIDRRYSIWHKAANKTGRVELGAITREELKMISMYGIAATEMDSGN